MKVTYGIILIVSFACANVIAKSTGSGDSASACPIEDPIHLPGVGPLNISFHPIAEIHEGGQRSNVHITGLSTFNQSYEVILLIPAFHFEIHLAELELSANYSATGYLDASPISESCIPSGNFTGSGSASVTAKDVSIYGYVYFFINIITNLVSIRILELDSVSFNSVSVNLGPDFFIGESPVDWDAFNTNIKSCFDAEFAANQVEIVEKIRVAINEKIKIYTLEEIVEYIGGCGYKL